MTRLIPCVLVCLLASCASRSSNPPEKVIYQTTFDAKPAGDLELVNGSARAVPRENGRRQWLRLAIDPPKPVGGHTMLRFRYQLTGADVSKMTVQIFDATVQDNRHVILTGLKQNEWAPATIDLTKDSKRNDGSSGTFAAGNLVDDIFLFLDHPAGAKVTLLIDDVTLYDAAP